MSYHWQRHARHKDRGSFTVRLYILIFHSWNVIIMHVERLYIISKSISYQTVTRHRRIHLHHYSTSAPLLRIRSAWTSLFLQTRT